MRTIHASMTKGNIAFINVHIDVHIPFIFIDIFLFTFISKYSDKAKKWLEKLRKKNGERERKNTLLQHNRATYKSTL